MSNWVLSLLKYFCIDLFEIYETMFTKIIIHSLVFYSGIGLDIGKIEVLYLIN